jgi:hypothetical protein
MGLSALTGGLRGKGASPPPVSLFDRAAMADSAAAFCDAEFCGAPAPSMTAIKTRYQMQSLPALQRKES